MTTQRWAEASLKSQWWDRWPHDPEYRALREAKRQFDTDGPTASWCECGYHCQCDDQGYRVVIIDGQTAAAVRRGRNKYGYESGIFVSDCNDASLRKWLTRWDGVPLLVNDVVQEERLHIDRRSRVHLHDGGTEIIDHRQAHRGARLTPVITRVRGGGR